MNAVGEAIVICKQFTVHSLYSNLLVLYVEHCILLSLVLRYSRCTGSIIGYARLHMLGLSDRFEATHNLKWDRSSWLVDFVTCAFPENPRRKVRSLIGRCTVPRLATEIQNIPRAVFDALGAPDRISSRANGAAIIARSSSQLACAGGCQKARERVGTVS